MRTVILAVDGPWIGTDELGRLVLEGDPEVGLRIRRAVQTRGHTVDYWASNVIAHFGRATTRRTNDCDDGIERRGSPSEYEYRSIRPKGG